MSFRKPTPEAMRRFLAEQRTLRETYPAVGATAKTPPTGYDVDRTRVRLGQGQAVFDSARAALERWEQFQLGWAEAWPTRTPIRTGEVVAVLGHALGLWWLNACRVVYVVDESGPGPTTRFGFAYGTLPQHVESGEERFLIEWDRDSDRVSYDILAFSRPYHALARIGYPLVRRLQRRFGRDSARAMRAAVQSPREAGADPF